ncbi:MAG: LytR/AlgR family response regulator transcription factor [Saprospiraceae bacterium]
MSKLKILIIEDDMSFALELEMMLAKDYDVLPIAKSVEKAMTIFNNEKVDLIISDVFLEGEATGVDLIKQIKTTDIPIIMMTFSKDEALYSKAKCKNLVGYLVKPFDKLTLISTMDREKKKKKKAKESIDSVGASEGQIYSDSFFIRTNKQLVKVFVKDINWIQSDGNYCLVVTNSRKYAIKLSLTKLLKKLPAGDFIQAHKRYIVQLGAITQIDTSASKLYVEEEIIPIGRKYKPQLLENLERFV